MDKNVILNILNSIDRKSCTDRVNGLIDLAIYEIEKDVEESKLETKKIKTKNLNSFKYKKNDVMLNNFSDFALAKINMVVVQEQGTDLVISAKEEVKKEYAVIKVYFN